MLPSSDFLLWYLAGAAMHGSGKMSGYAYRFQRLRYGNPSPQHGYGAYYGSRNGGAHGEGRVGYGLPRIASLF